MKGGKYAKTLAKIQVREIFHIWDIQRDLYGDAMLVPNENICSPVLLQKHEFILWGTHKH